VVSATGFAIGHGRESDDGRDRGDTHQTWCDINPACNGWNAVVMPAVRARYYAAPVAPAPIYAKAVVVKPPKPRHKPAPVLAPAMPTNPQQSSNGLQLALAQMFGLR
jgi:hypothetical protein